MSGLETNNRMECPMSTQSSLLRIDASARREGSVTRDLTDQIVAKFAGASVTTRDLATTPVPQIDETWVGANFTPADDRSDEQKAALALSDTLIDEIKAADVLVIGLPIYNFGVPTALKAWVDHIARAGVTFQYSETGPVGLLTDKRAIIVVASGGVAVDSEVDFATQYMRHLLGFVGITETEVVHADAMAVRGDEAMTAAKAQVEALAA